MKLVNGPAFDVWKQETLAEFARDAYNKLQEQAEEIERLRADLKDTRKAYRELIILHEDDGK
jgi:chaperonin cofactor prefoldin